MITIFKKELNGRTVALIATKPNQLDEYGTLCLIALGDETSDTITFTWDQSKNSFHISSTLNISGSNNANCFIICGIALAAPIIDCYKNNSGD